MDLFCSHSLSFTELLVAFLATESYRAYINKLALRLVNVSCYYHARLAKHANIYQDQYSQEFSITVAFIHQRYVKKSANSFCSASDPLKFHKTWNQVPAYQNLIYLLHEKHPNSYRCFGIGTIKQQHSAAHQSMTVLIGRAVK